MVLSIRRDFRAINGGAAAPAGTALIPGGLLLLIAPWGPAGPLRLGTQGIATKPKRAQESQPSQQSAQQIQTGIPLEESETGANDKDFAMKSGTSSPAKAPAKPAPRAEDDHVLTFDATLRDGEQCPGATMTHEEKLEVAEMLDTMGVDVIEAGFPIASEGDFAAVNEIAKRSKNAVVCGLSRAGFKD